MVEEKKKKGQLDKIVFPEFKELKLDEKKLPTLDIPKFSKFDDKKKPEKEEKHHFSLFKHKPEEKPKFALPELRLPSFDKKPGIPAIKGAVEPAAKPEHD